MMMMMMIISLMQGTFDEIQGIFGLIQEIFGVIQMMIVSPFGKPGLRVPSSGV
jgi:hypothetical protein